VHCAWKSRPRNNCVGWEVTPYTVYTHLWRTWLSDETTYHCYCCCWWWWCRLLWRRGGCHGSRECVRAAAKSIKFPRDDGRPLLFTPSSTHTHRTPDDHTITTTKYYYTGTGNGNYYDTR